MTQPTTAAECIRTPMSDFTNDELVTLRTALNAWAVGSINKASYNWHAADLGYVLAGGGSKNVEACQALITRIDAELERRNKTFPDL